MHKLYRLIKNRVDMLTIYQKLVCYIVFIIIIPFGTLYYFSEKTTSEIIVEQLCKDTLNSIELASKSIDELHKRIYSAALYINNDANMDEYVGEDNAQIKKNDGQNDYNNKMKEYLQFKRMEKTINNLSNITIGSKSYMTVITLDGKIFSNWPRDSKKSAWFINEYGNLHMDKANDLILWLGLEENYVSEERGLYPYVFTIVTNISKSTQNNPVKTFVISIPEQEFVNLISKGNRSEERFLVDNQGKIISSTKKELLNREFKNVYGKEIPADSKGYRIFSNQGVKSILTYYKVGSTGWRVVDVKLYEDITEKQIQNRNRLLLITFLCLGIFFIILLFLARNITLPLKRLTRAMQSTDFIYRKEGTAEKRKDEIGILQQSFETMKVNINNLLQENKLKEKRKRDAEMKAMQAQISPHFLFNTLNAIRWAAINKNNEKTADMVLALSNLLHMTIVKGNEMITLEQEKENLENYVNILKMRHSRVFDIVIDISDEIKDYKIPKLLLQPLVENSITHGFEGLKPDGLIEVKGFLTNDGVSIFVKDNGTGMDPEALIEDGSFKEYKFSGIGLTNIDERIKLYYGEEFGLHINSAPGEGTCVSMVLPLDMKGDL